MRHAKTTVQISQSPMYRLSRFIREAWRGCFVVMIAPWGNCDQLTQFIPRRLIDCFNHHDAPSTDRRTGEPAPYPPKLSAGRAAWLSAKGRCQRLAPSDSTP